MQRVATLFETAEHLPLCFGERRGSVLEIAYILARRHIQRLCAQQRKSARHADFVIVRAERGFLVVLHHPGEDEVSKLPTVTQ
ncbi:MAG: hypothetical protein L0H63_12675 [Nitrococcus sp.]|nr:hypothetical protein [Nitrococcus sp.]